MSNPSQAQQERFDQYFVDHARVHFIDQLDFSFKAVL